MKKLVSILLALVMAMGLTVSVFAKNIESAGPDGNTDSKNVEIIVNESGKNTTVYYVVVEWGNLTFTYQKDVTDGWDPESHSYSKTASAGWVSTGANDTVDNNSITRANAITVTNHSNADVKVSALFDNDASEKNSTNGSNTGVKATIATTATSEIVLSATNHLDKYDEAEKISYNLTVSGTPTVSEENFGTITVTISKSTT